MNILRAVVLVLLLASAARTQTKPVDVKQALAAIKDPGGKATSSTLPLVLFGVEAFPCDKETAEMQKACFSARKAYYDYYTSALTKRTGVYQWNDISTKAIFIVVILLVGFGVYLSWVQFFGYRKQAARALPSKKAMAAAAGTPSCEPQPDLTSELDLKLSGLHVKSPVLGVILLTLSLAFFYLYLVFVYPVTEGF